MSIPEKGRFVSCALKGTFPGCPLTTRRHSRSMSKRVKFRTSQKGKFYCDINYFIYE